MAKCGTETTQLDMGSQSWASFTPSYLNFSADKISEITIAIADQFSVYVHINRHW